MQTDRVIKPSSSLRASPVVSGIGTEKGRYPALLHGLPGTYLSDQARQVSAAKDRQYQGSAGEVMLLHNSRPGVQIFADMDG